jgi:hypothetical protein
MTFLNIHSSASSAPTTILPPQDNPARPLINSRATVTDSFQPTRPQTTGAFAGWMRSLRQKEHVLYAVTVTYCDNSSSPFTVGSAQRRANRFYNYLLSRLFHRRHYNAPEYRPLQPLMLLFLDTPGSKRKNSTPQLSYTNTAPYHHHGFLAARPSLASTIDGIAQSLIAGYRDSSLLDGIQSVLVEPLDFNIGKWTRYASAFDRGDYLLLPKSKTEFAEPVRCARTTESATECNSTSTH